MGDEALDHPDLAQDELARRFTGKRRIGRQWRRLEVQCSRGEARFAGRTLDASPLGMLVEVAGSTEFGVTEEAGSFEAACRVLADFGDEMDVRFTHTGIPAKGRIVRVAVSPDSPDRLLLGCEFVPPLTRAQCDRLALDWVEGDEEESAGDDAA
jgi:hypothetical protein